MRMASVAQTLKFLSVLAMAVTSPDKILLYNLILCGSVPQCKWHVQA